MLNKSNIKLYKNSKSESKVINLEFLSAIIVEPGLDDSSGPYKNVFLVSAIMKKGKTIVLDSFNKKSDADAALENVIKLFGIK